MCEVGIRINGLEDAAAVLRFRSVLHVGVVGFSDQDARLQGSRVGSPTRG